MPKEEKQLTEAEQLQRDWDKSWDNFCAGQGGEPNNHPTADHPYNVNRKKYIAQMSGTDPEDEY